MIQLSRIRKTLKRYKRQIIGYLGMRGAEVSVLSVADKPQLELAVTNQPCSYWVGTNRGSRITFTSKPVLTASDRVFTMGSCFAVEIRKALSARGFDTYPKYAAIDFDQSRQVLAKMPKSDNINHYNTFVIRQEFELALSNGSYIIGDLVDLGKGKADAALGKSLRWQDPYRKMVYAADEVSIVDLSGKVTGCIRSAIQMADVYIITLGLTEVWKNNVNGLYINQAPKTVDSRFSFIESSYEQNFDNMRQVCSLIAEHYPQKRIILTVSPVPLTRTFTDRDIVVANTESKSILRAVAGRIAKDFGNVTYWPSYEIALARDLFLEDGRHVRPDGIDLIVDQFLKVHV